MTARPIPPSRLRLASLALAALAAVLLALLLAAPVFSKASSNVVGIAAALVRDVQVKPASLRAFARAKLRQRLSLADQVRTGADSRLQIALLDNTKISVGSNAQLTIDKFIYDPNNGSVSVSAAKGALRFMSGPSRSDRTMRTPSATIGIRGTVFDTAVGALAVQIAQRERAIPQGTRHDPLTATLAVLRGPGPKRQGYAKVGEIDVNAAGQTVALEQPLLAAYVPYAGAPPIGPFTISLPGLALLNDFILPPPPRRDFPQATEAHPVPHRERAEPPPWYTGGEYPPGAGPGPGYGTPGGTDGGNPTFPGFDGFPQRPAGPVNDPVAGRPPANATPTPTPSPTPTTTTQPPVNRAPPTTTTTTTAQPAGTPGANNPNSVP